MIKCSHTDTGNLYEINSTVIVTQAIRLKLKKTLYKYNKKFGLNWVLSELKSKTLMRERIGWNENCNCLVHQFEVIKRKDFVVKKFEQN